MEAFGSPASHHYKATKLRSPIEPDEVIYRTKLAGQAAGLEVNGEMGAMMLAVFADLGNIYITGAAGTGKTTFVKHILIPELDRRGLNFHITASTGIAGSHVDGKTLHSFLGIGLGPEWPPGVPVLSMQLWEIEKVYEATYKRWQDNPRISAAMRKGLTQKLEAAEVVVLEEVSMIPGWALLGYVDYFLRRVRRKPEQPFGGIQMIYVGDFGQLPPVEKFQGQRPDWAFACAIWTQSRVRAMKFTKIHRQKEGWFPDFLNETHDGLPISPVNKERLRAHVIPGATPQTHSQYSFLCATNKEADADNAAALRQYPGAEVRLDASFEIRPEQLKNRETIEEVQRRLIEGKATIRATLTFKVGLPVIITVNNTAEGYVNGTKGFIHDFTYDGTGADQRVAVIQVRVPHPDWPERLRAQLTPEQRERLETFDTIHAIGVRYWSRSTAEDPDDIEPMSPVEYAAEIAEGRVPKPRRKWPCVAQFPLIPATAITIHKSQGMSLDEVVIRADRAFAPGQVYVALSRLRSPEGLVLTSLDLPIFADPSAAAFNATIEAPCVDMGEPLPPLDDPPKKIAKELPMWKLEMPAGAPTTQNEQVRKGVDFFLLRRADAKLVELKPALPAASIRGRTTDSVIVDDCQEFDPAMLEEDGIDYQATDSHPGDTYFDRLAAESDDTPPWDPDDFKR